MADRNLHRVAVCQRFAEAVHAPIALAHPTEHYFRASGGIRLAAPTAAHADLARPVVLFVGEDQTGPQPGPHVFLAKSLLHRLARLVA